MSQESTLKILNENKSEWLSAREIHSKLDKNITLCCVRGNLKKLYKCGFVKKKEFYRGGHEYFKYKVVEK